MLSNHFRFGLPLILFPDTSITITLLPILVFSSQNMPIQLQTTFLHFLGYFSHLRYSSKSFIPYQCCSLFCPAWKKHSSISATHCVLFTGYVSAALVMVSKRRFWAQCIQYNQCQYRILITYCQIQDGVNPNGSIRFKIPYLNYYSC